MCTVKSSIPARAKADRNRAGSWATSTLRSSAPNKASVGVRTLDRVAVGSKRMNRRRASAVSGVGGIGESAGTNMGRYALANQGLALAAEYSWRAASQVPVPAKAAIRARHVLVAEAIASAS